MSVFAAVKDIKSFFTVATDKARIDNLIFQAHYRATTSFFFVACIFVTAFSFIGNPIYCIMNHEFNKDFVNQFCWTMSTYTIQPRKDVLNGIYPGIPATGDDLVANGYKKTHTYYQWVPFMLFLHGLCFYLPHWIWKTWEGGRVKLMSQDIRGTLIEDNESTRKKREQVVDYLVSTLHTHKKYAYAYFFCEVLNLINTILTMFIIDEFLDHVFWTSGTDVLKFTRTETEERIRINDTLIYLFPRMTICDLKTYGPAGAAESRNALCVLPLNAVNEKIYIFAWFWLILLAVVTFIAISYSAAFLALPDIRRMVIVKRFKFGNKYEVNELIRQIGVGDFVLLHLLGQNLSTMTFHQLLEDLNNRLLYPHKSIKSNTCLKKIKPIDEADYPPKSNSDGLYPSYYKPTDTLEIDSVDSKEPLMIRERTVNKQQNEKSLV